MPLDAFCLSAVREELARQITGMRIDKVQQPERDVIILSLRGSGVAHRLLISAGSGDMRVHLTEHQFENPASPPMFCMLLRKHLTGARIKSIIQPPGERVLEFLLESMDAMGVFSEKKLVIELMGRMSNVVLIDADSGVIDCLRRVAPEPGKRVMLPGLLYRPPPPQEGKVNPLFVLQEEWRALFGLANEQTVDKWLLSSFFALSPLICRELSHRAYGTGDFRMDAIRDGGEALCREFFALTETVAEGRFQPCLISDLDNAPRDFSYVCITQYEGALTVTQLDSFASMLDGFYTRTAQLDRVRQRASAMSKTVRNARDRLVRKLAAQREELKKTADREVLRECGDIITANMFAMKKGQSELIAADFYAEADGATRKIALDIRKTPQQNAAKYYKDYTKAKNAEKFLTEQIVRGETELLYLESVLGDIALAEGERDLEDVRRELMQTGYLKTQKQGKQKVKESAPMRFESSSGAQILAGRNNTQNDKLTLKIASKTDVWLHAQKIHGAHVIISCAEMPLDEATLYEAAAIAAYYSSSRAGGKVPVDYALVRHVKKPSGGRPGMVTYTDFKTIIVSPDEELVRQLRKG